MPQVHDRGGRPDAGPINKAEHDLSMWEKRTDALGMLLSSPKTHLIRVDELRRAIESLPPDAYEKMSYYERWISSIETLLIEKGVPIAGMHGAFRNPETLAYGGDGLPKQPLYLVRFTQQEVWGSYAAAPHDTLFIDIYEHWLEPVGN